MHSWIGISLKGDIVGVTVFLRIVYCILLRRTLRRLVYLARRAWRPTCRAGSKLHRVGVYFGLVVLDPILLPTAGLDATLNVRSAPLFEILRARLRLAAKHHHVMKFDFFLLGTVGFFVRAVGGDCKAAHLGAARERAELRVAGQVSKHHCFVDIHIRLSIKYQVASIKRFFLIL